MIWLIEGRPPVVVYSGPLCSGCEEVKAYLADRAIPYEERNIRANIETMIAFRRKGCRKAERGRDVLRRGDAFNRRECKLGLSIFKLQLRESRVHVGQDRGDGPRR